MIRKKAVIFDVDGLLLNTEFTWLECWNVVAEENGVSEFGYLFHKAVGTTGNDIERMLERELPDLTDQMRHILLEDVRKVGMKMVDDRLALMPGVPELLDDLDDQGYRVAVATTTSRELTEHRLKKMGVYDRFEYILCGNEVVKRKPDPEIYLKVLNALELRQEEVLVLEDTGYGVAAASAAGCDVIMVPSVNEPTEADEARAYSIEKDQITLLKAMKYSRYADRIRLVLAGRGPNERQLRRAAAKLVRRGVLKHPPVFGFFGLAELRAIYRRADLYIHCAVIEVEGLSCMEAIQEGVVPIIAKGKLTATAQYAKDEESRYPERNAKALAARIDYWLSDDDRRKKTAERYRGTGAEYDIHRSIEALQKMYRDALDQSFLT